ncbi:MAG: LuxR C-terminal-related transcriptional regulator [Legionellaceae bacterium]|nr:LuxR C-terminal-related transcriptional regulator [Legionellaceae bacterium]
MFNHALAKYFSMTTHVAEMTKPLQELGISGFFYMRIYPDNSFINITSRYEHANNYFNQLFSGNYQPKDLSEQLFTLPGASLSALNLDNKVWQDANNLGYGNAISIYDGHEHMQEITCFYSSSENHDINHFYINQLDFLRKFKVYFVERADEIIQKIELDKCFFPDSLREECNQPKMKQEKQALTVEILESLMSQNSFDAIAPKLSSAKIQPDQVILTHQKTGIPLHLPPQRAQCLIHAAHGKTAKEIAKDMNLSVKTIDYYLRILRKELGCCSTKRLIAAYFKQLELIFDTATR